MIVRSKTLKRFAGAVAFAVGGSLSVFGLMLLMNGLSEPPKDKDFGEQASFEVAPEPEPPKRPDPPAKKRQKPQKTQKQAAPPPQINSAIGSAGFEMPGFSPSNVDKASKKLVGDVKASVMTADSVDRRPEPVQKVDPKLPRRVVARQIEGKVIVKALVDKEGTVANVRVVRAKPKGVFENHVLEAVKRWQFQPATYEGKAVKTWIELPFNFELG